MMDGPDWGKAFRFAGYAKIVLLFMAALMALCMVGLFTGCAATGPKSNEIVRR